MCANILSKEIELQTLVAANESGQWYSATERATNREVEAFVWNDSVNPAVREASTARLAKIALAQSPAVRSILRNQEDIEPYFVILESLPHICAVERRLEAAISTITAVDITRRIAGVLSGAHRFGISDLQICPVHIRLYDDVEWKIDISGLHRPVTGTQHQQICDACVAPEAARDEWEPASDAYSLGATLAWLLFAEGGEKGGSLLNSDSIAQWQSNLDVDQATAEQIISLLAALLSEDPSTRPSLQDVNHQLAHIQDSLGAPAVSATVTATPGQEASNDSGGFAKTMAAEISPKIPPCGFGAPEQLGRFQILKKLGQGGMGAVYLAKDLTTGREVAVKVVSFTGSSDDESNQKRFAKEARMLSRLSSPYVANLLEFNEDDGVQYIATEYVEGTSLAELLQNSATFSVESVLALVIDVVRGLAAAHVHGIVHRDVKPDNILVTTAGLARCQNADSENGNVRNEALAKLTDFGLARNEDQTESMAMTTEGAVIGTPLYMPPEQCQGKATTTASDVYSTGATLFHLLAGKPPFKGDTFVELIQKHVHEPPPSIRQIRPDISEGLQQVIEKSLAKNPDARYANAEELLTDLEKIQLGQPTSVLIHPRIAEHDSSATMEYQFTKELNSSPAELWPFVSDTERLNRSIGLPAVVFTNRTDNSGRVRRHAATRIAGLAIEWEEHPFEWIEGRRMAVLREFSKGPFRWLVSIVEMVPRGRGTTLKHRVLLQPRNALGRLVGMFEVGVKARRSLDWAYHQMDGYVTGNGFHDPSIDTFGKRVALSSGRSRRLSERMNRLKDFDIDPVILDVLRQFLNHASDQDVARIRPHVFAERFGLDVDQTLEACLRAAESGLLVLLWDILCPSCRIPADIKETLASVSDHGHCEACNVDFDLDFGNSIELIFRAHPEIRDVEVRTYCIGGPAFSAHVVSQVCAAPGERVQLELALVEGSYSIRGPQLPFVTEFSVSPSGASGRWKLGLSRPPNPEMIPVLKSGSQVVILRNETSNELQVRLERTATRRDAVTAADASSNAVFRELFPGEVLSAGQMVSVTSLAIMMIHIDGVDCLYLEQGDGTAFEKLNAALMIIEQETRQSGGAVIKNVGEGAVCTFPDALAAIRTAISLTPKLKDSELTQDLTLSISLHCGSALAATINGRLDYFGGTVHMASKLLNLASPGDLVLTEAIVSSADVGSFLRENAITLEVVDAFFDDLIVQQCQLPS